MANPKIGETREEFIPRCITILVNEGYSDEQAIAVCETKFEAFSNDALIEWTDETKGGGVFAMGFVDEPAVMNNFTYLKSQTKEKLSIVELIKDKDFDEKGIIVGVALIPELPIYRQGEEEGDEGYYAFFTKERIAEMAHKFLANNNHVFVTSPHKVPVEGVKLIETWLVENKEDKINTVYGKQVPLGTWCLKYDVNGNPELKEKIKNGDIKGYSIEALLKEIEVEMNAENEIKELEEMLKLIELLIVEKISFDVDGTLTKEKYQNLAKEYMGNDVIVVIVTGRNDEDMEPVFELARQLGIPKENIFNSSGKSKIPILQRIGATKHYDNNKNVIDEINKIPGILGVLAN